MSFKSCCCDVLRILFCVPLCEDVVCCCYNGCVDFLSYCRSICKKEEVPRRIHVQGREGESQPNDVRVDEDPEIALSSPTLEGSTHYALSQDLYAATRDYEAQSTSFSSPSASPPRTPLGSPKERERQFGPSLTPEDARRIHKNKLIKESMTYSPPLPGKGYSSASTKQNYKIQKTYYP